MGFRKLCSNLIFSKFYNNTNKKKFEKSVKENVFYMASFYGPVQFYTPNVLIFNQNTNQGGRLIASG